MMMHAGAEIASAARPLRILLSAYACEPHKGSEPGIGWHWAVALARAGHHVWVLTRANNRDAIENALAGQPVPTLQFVYYDLPPRLRWWKRGGRGVRLYYVLWQWGAYLLARRVNQEVGFDVVHHITFGVFRHPSFMAFLDVPFVFGPVGGGETAPFSLRKTFPTRGYLTDLLRDAANRLARVDPLMAVVYRRSAAILCKTRETLECIPPRYRDKCRVRVEVGIDEDGMQPMPGKRRSEDGCFRVLYAGRLVYWKGLHLGLMAFARFLGSHAQAHLTVIGSGPDQAWFHHLAQELGIDRNITWIPWLERQAVMQIYPEHDAFLFPSLHDSSGNVVLEALSCGLPVVCLDAGGPAVLVDASCGFRIKPGRPDEVVDSLARALAVLASNATQAQAMGEAAVRRARRQFSWSSQAARMESLYLGVCGEPDSVQRPMAQPVERGAR